MISLVFRIMLDLKKYRVIDLSQSLRPGILKVDGSYIYGSPKILYDEPRRLELRQFTYDDNEYMHFIDTETHIGTHVEAPSHVMVGGSEPKKNISDFSVEKWMGEAIVLDFSYRTPIDGVKQPITPEDLSEVREGDIVLLWTRLSSDKQPYISREACEFLIRKKVKLMSWEGMDIGGLSNHNSLLENEVCFIEGLVNLDKIMKKRVFYIGLALNWHGIDASPIRAIVLEEID